MNVAKLVNSVNLVRCENVNMEDVMNDFERTPNDISFLLHLHGLGSTLTLSGLGHRPVPVFGHFQ